MEHIDWHRVLEHLYQAKDVGRGLDLKDFAGLGISNNLLGECVDYLKDQGWCAGHVHRSSDDDSGVDDIIAKITPGGCRELGY